MRHSFLSRFVSSGSCCLLRRRQKDPKRSKKIYSLGLLEGLGLARRLLMLKNCETLKLSHGACLTVMKTQRHFARPIRVYCRFRSQNQAEEVRGGQEASFRHVFCLFSGLELRCQHRVDVLLPRLTKLQQPDKSNNSCDMPS